MTTLSKADELINKGLDYWKHLSKWETSKLLTEEILLNMAVMAVNNLLAGLALQYDLKSAHGDIASHLRTLKTEMPIPVEVEVASRAINSTCASCGAEGNLGQAVDMAVVATNVKLVKEWVLNNKK